MNTMIEQLQIISDLSGEQRIIAEEPFLATIRCKSEKTQLHPQSTESMDDWRQVNFRFRSYEFSILVRKYIISPVLSVISSTIVLHMTNRLLYSYELKLMLFDTLSAFH